MTQLTIWTPAVTAQGAAANPRGKSAFGMEPLSSAEFPQTSSGRSAPSDLLARATDVALAVLFRTFGSHPAVFSHYAYGIASTNFRASYPGGEFLVRCDFRRTLDQVNEDLSFQRRARLAGLNTPDESVVAEVVQGIVVTARPLVPGMTFLEHKHVPVSCVREAGRQLAALHALTSPINRRFFYRFVTTTDDDWWTSTLPHATRHPQGKLAILSHQLIEEVRTYAQERAPNDLVRQALIHGDYTYANLLLSDDAHVVVLDWEKACPGPVLFDLARALFFAACGDMNPPDISVIRPFLEGYDSTTSITASERRRLPEIMRVAASAFLLADIAQASPTRTPASVFDPRRQAYVDEFCLPRYQFFVSEWHQVVGIFSDLCDS